MHIDIRHPRAMHCQSYLDGKPVKHCIAADDEKGWVQRYKADANGGITVDPVAAAAEYGRDPAEMDYGMIVETLHGKVELVFNDAEEGRV